jgi:L-ascorbate metabolism protein UlaG (beta-lactamase superfamily)
MERKVRITWLGHAGLRIVSPGGKTLLIDPWLKNNPSCPQELKAPSKADLLLLTHGHFDHFEDALEIARSHDPKVVANFEICQYLQSEGVQKTLPMAAVACRLLRPRRVLPVHYGTFPPLTGRPGQLRELTADLPEMEILALEPGETWTA